MLQKTLFYASLILLLGSCKKEEQDFRTKYTADFDFTVIEEFWLLGQDTLSDTSIFTGTIRKFSIEDDTLDLDGNEFHYNTLDPDKRITITFAADKTITPEITNDGQFMLIQAHHYFHRGGFGDANTLEFAVLGLGGLGGGWNYYVSGKRKLE
jgi:hypothetical protein